MNVTLHSVFNQDPELLEWVLAASPQKLIAAVNIGRWAIERVIHLGVTDEDTAAIILQAKQDADAAAHDLINQMEQQMKKTVMQKDIEIHQKTLELQSIQRHLSDKDVKLRDMDMALKNIVKEFCEGELKDLRRQVQERENEIKALRNTNATKCVIGETLIMDTLRSIYTRSEIAHTGKQAHECDIHMTDSDNHLMIFESKYKNTITKQDVDKFYYDIQNQPAERAVIGAVFISLNTPNIPTKGDICIELANNTYTTIPILFVGFRTPEEFTMNFPAIVTMFTALCKYQYRVNAQKSNDDSKDATKDYEAKLQQILQEIDTVLALISSNKSRITELRKIATDLEENQKATLSCLSNIATSIDPQRATHSYNPIISNPKQPKTVYTCDKCKTATFTNKKELAKHGRICVNGPANTNTH